MDQPAYHMDQTRRAGLQAIQEVCGDRGWNLLAAHVRSHPVHTVVEAEAEPERVMHDFQIYASRRLNTDEPGRTEPEAMGTPREHTMAVETTARLRGHTVRSRRAGRRPVRTRCRASNEGSICGKVPFFRGFDFLTPSYGRGSDWL